MFVEKNSALKGFSLFFYIVCLIVSFAGCCNSNSAFFIIPSAVVVIAGFAAVYVLTKYWNGDYKKK